LAGAAHHAVMNIPTTSPRFSSLSIALHWLTLAVLVGVYACINLTDLYPKGSDMRALLKTWHFMLGLSVLLLVGVRLIARAWGVTPPITPELPLWQTRLSGLIHLALYGLMLAMPLLGWWLLSAEGKPIPFFGWQLPFLTLENHDLADQIKDVHETIGSIGYFLIGAHAFAALYHHYVQRDNTLLRMLPGRR
jgi:cytochrome b561